MRIILSIFQLNSSLFKNGSRKVKRDITDW